MPNGRPGDHPLTDLLVHKQHPFPRDVEELILAIYKIKPSAVWELGIELFKWERGENLDEAPRILKEKLRQLQAGQTEQS